MLLAVVLGVLVLAAVPPVVAVAALIGAVAVGVLTFLARLAGGLGPALSTWTWRAAAGAGLATLAVQGLVSWLGPASVVVLAIGSLVVMIYLSRLVLRRPCP